MSVWRQMAATNIVVAAALLVYKVGWSYPGEQYTQLLMDYHYGFTKRALIGFVVSLAFPVIPPWSPFVLGGIVLALTAALFLWLFHKSYGFSEQTLPLLIFTAGSPFFLKNFIQTLGYYDIYGCLLAIVLLLLPARSICICWRRRSDRRS